MRKYCNCIGKKSCIKNNKYYGVKRGRVFFIEKRWTAEGKGDFEIINKVDDSIHKYGNRIRDCLKLQRLFGLRKRESLRFHPYLEIRTDENGNPIKIELTLGTKNNRSRTIPVSTETQQAFLKILLETYQFSPIQPDTVDHYTQWERVYFYVLDKLGINGLRTGHGLRQIYANERFMTLLEEARRYSEINNFHESEEKLRLVAYQKLTQELGHGRIDILKSYLADYLSPRHKKNK